MRSYIFMLPILFFITLSLKAQNTVLIDPPKALPSNLSKIIGSEFSQGDSLETYTQSLFERFTKKHLESSYYDNVDLMNLYNWTNQSFAKRLKIALTSDRKKLKKLYKSLLPLMKVYFQQMTSAEQQEYKGLLEEGEAYLKNFDLEAERSDLEEKKRHVFFREKGAVKTFLYRRIANNELSQKECVKWIKQLKSDFLPLVDKNKTKIDQYFLLGVNYGAYQLASSFPRQDNYLLLKKEGTDYKTIELAEGAKVYSSKEGERYYLQVYRPLDRNGTVLQAFKLKDGRVGIYWFPAEGGYAQIETLEKGKHPDLRGYNYIQHENVILHKNKVFAVNKSNEIEAIELDENTFSKSVFEFNYKDGTRRVLIKNPKLEIDRKKVEKVYYPFHSVAILDTDGQLGFIDGYEDVISFDAKITNMITNSDYCIWTLESGEQQLWTRTRNSRRTTYQHYPLSPDYLCAKIEESLYSEFIFSTKDGKKGVIDNQGKLIIPAEYRNLKVLSNSDDITGTYHVYLYQKNTTDSYGVVEKGGGELTKEFFSELDYLKLSSEKEKTLYRFRDTKTGKIGVLNNKFKVLIQPKYSYFGFGMKQDYTKLLMSTTAKEYKELSLAEIENGAKVEHLYGMIDLSGNEVLAEQYFGIAIANLNGKTRYLLGKEITPKQYAYAIADEEYKILTDFRFGYQIKRDTIITFNPKTFEEIENVVLNQDIYLCAYSEIDRDCREDILKLTVDGKVGLFDFNGGTVLKPEWDEIGKPSLGQDNIYVYKGNKQGVFDLKNEKMLIPANYKAASVLEFAPNYLALLQSPKNGYWAVVSNPKEKPQFLYKEVESHTVRKRGIVFASKDGEKYAMLNNGKAVTDYLFKPEINDLVTFDPDYFEEIIQKVESSVVLNGDYKEISENPKSVILSNGEQKVYYLYDWNGNKLKEGDRQYILGERKKMEQN